MVMTYNSLVAQVTSYLNRTDTATLDQIPNFIYQAEQRICRESKNVGLEVYVTGTFITNNSVIAKPARWRRNITFNYGTGVLNNTRNTILLRSYEFCRAYWPDPTLSAPPKFYADYGYYNLLIVPTPDQAYPFELGYLQLPDPISPNNQTNWITNYAPDVFLYATLLEAMPFLKDDERIPVWKEYYDRGLSSLNQQDDQRIYDRSGNRSAD